MQGMAAALMLYLAAAAAALREAIEEVRGCRMLLAEGGLDQKLSTGLNHR